MGHFGWTQVLLLSHLLGMLRPKNFVKWGVGEGFWFCLETIFFFYVNICFGRVTFFYVNWIK